MKILLIDIESSYNVARVWGKYEQNVLGDFIEERKIISFAWKWHGEKTTHVMSMKGRNDNEHLVIALYKLMEQADVVVGHNLANFDEKMINTEFVLAGLNPPKRHRIFDTLKEARKYFRFNSNKLNDLGKRLKVGQKAHTGGFDLWVKCMDGDRRAWHTMEQYNKQDVILLEQIYAIIKPWSERPALKRIR